MCCKLLSHGYMAADGSVVGTNVFFILSKCFVLTEISSFIQMVCLLFPPSWTRSPLKTDHLNVVFMTKGR